MNNTATPTNIDYTGRIDAPIECPFARQIGFGLHASRFEVIITKDSEWHGLTAGDRTYAWAAVGNCTTLWTPAHFCEWSSGIQFRRVV